MVLGYGMIYNHQNNPNTEWRFNYQGLLADVVAIKPIKASDEIFVHYGNNYFKNREYFDDTKVRE
jgi:SET domain-containing protein